LLGWLARNSRKCLSQIEFLDAKLSRRRRQYRTSAIGTPQGHSANAIRRIGEQVPIQDPLIVAPCEGFDANLPQVVRNINYAESIKGVVPLVQSAGGDLNVRSGLALFPYNILAVHVASEKNVVGPSQVCFHVLLVEFHQPSERVVHHRD